MKFISVLNQKGGCGKTSLAVLIVLALSSTGKKVLAIDCDPQGGLTSFLLPSDQTFFGLFELIGGFKKLNEVIYKTDRGGMEIEIIPSDYKLDSIAPTLDPYALKRLFKNLKGYDYVIFDNPPTVQGISRASSILADEIYIPADISAPTLGPTKYTIKALEDIDKKGKVILVGYKEPRDENKGFMAELSRKFIDSLNGHYVGTVPKTITSARAIADPGVKWTASKIESLLEPLLDIMEVKRNERKAV